MKDYKDIKLKCPKCDGIITLGELLDGNSKEINDFFESKNESIKKELQKDLEKQFEKEKELEILKIEQDMSDKISDLKSKINSIENKKEKEQMELENEYKIKLSNYKNEILMKEKEIENAFSKIEITKKEAVIEAIREKELEIQKLALQLENQQREILEKNKQEILMSKLNFEKEKETIIKLYSDQIKELEIANAQNKILQNKTKGENWEIEVEGELRKCFGTFDKIEKATTVNENTKPDFLQSVKTTDGDILGTIVYEVKNATWSDSWEEKLNLDIFKNKGKYGILVTARFEEKFSGVPFIKSEKFDNIWITNSDSFIFVGQMLRSMIIFESNYKQELAKLNKLIDQSDSQEMKEIMEEYTTKLEKIKEFWTIDAPKAFSVCRKELENLDAVSRTLIKSSEKIDKAKERIQKRLERDLIQKLELILGDLKNDIDFSEE